MQSISFIIPTYNEEIHIERCIKSVANYAEKIYIIDSYSTDSTVQLAGRLGCEIIYRKFDNHSNQLNAALRTINCKSDWIFRIDADEVLDEKNFIKWIKISDRLSNQCNGCTVRRDIIFQGRLVRFGGVSMKRVLRIFRPNKAWYDGRPMDERLVVEGLISETKIRIIDDNKKSLRWWWRKHLHYAERESLAAVKENKKNSFSLTSRNIYYHLPSLIRPYFYFAYRYILLLGFLDGIFRPNYHCLQALRYRLLVEKKIVKNE